jgi:hypothetical protein
VAVGKRGSNLRRLRWTAGAERTEPLAGYANAPLQKKITAEVLDEVREHLRQKLPEYMVPSAFVFLDELPLTAHGKVDREALPPPFTYEQRDPDNQFFSPRTPTEEVLSNIWKQVLGLNAVSIHDDFFELGGHSLLATQVTSRINRAFQINLPVRSLFEELTIASLSRVIVEARIGERDVQDYPLKRIERSGNLPLSFAQQRLWFLDQWEPQNPFYNMPAAVRLRGELNLDGILKAVIEILRRLESLRTRVANHQGHPYQVIEPAKPAPLPIVDLSDLPEHQREAEAHRAAMTEFLTPFDLAQGPLVRIVLLRMEEDHHIALLTMHHIVGDGWSMGIFVREIAALYAAYTSDSPSPLPD